MRIETVELLKDLERIRESDKLLTKLMRHHESQAKDHTEPVTKQYNQQLADEIRAMLES